MAAIGRIRRSSATTVVQAPTQSIAKAVPSVSSKPGFTGARVFVTPEQVTDPAVLARVLNAIQSSSVASTVGARTSPLTQGGVHFRGVSFTAGTAKVLTHNLSRAAVGYLVTDTAPGAASALALRRTTLATGIDLSIALALIPSVTCTADVLVF